MRLLLLFFLFSISVNFLTLAVADELWQNEQDVSKKGTHLVVL